MTLTTKPGVYKHYKGGLYRVLFVARMSTNGPAENQPHVVYVSLTYGVINIRDQEEFHESINVNGTFVPRFSFVDERLTYED